MKKLCMIYLLALCGCFATGGSNIIFNAGTNGVPITVSAGQSSAVHAGANSDIDAKGGSGVPSNSRLIYVVIGAVGLLALYEIWAHRSALLTMAKLAVLP